MIIIAIILLLLTRLIAEGYFEGSRTRLPELLLTAGFSETTSRSASLVLLYQVFVTMIIRNIINMFAPPTCSMSFKVGGKYFFFQDDDSYGEDEFEKSAEEGEGGRRNSPRGGNKEGRKNEVGGKVPCEASTWPMSKRTAGLKTLKRLSKTNRCVFFISRIGSC